MQKFKNKLYDPLFYLGLFLLLFWLSDTYLKIFFYKSPSLILWWSSAGLGVTTYALLRRNVLLVTAMFCALTINESLWIISFFSNLIFKTDTMDIATYMFISNYPLSLYIIGLFHLFVIPAIFCGLVLIKQIHKKGWLVAYFFSLIITLGVLFFPDSRENVNCVRPQYIGCQTFFGFLHTSVYPISPFFAVLVATTLHAIFIFIPLNILLVKIAHKIQWKVIS